jgi:hypothetical protein
MSLSYRPKMSVVQITTKAEHDAAAEQAYAGTPTLLYVSNNSTPACRKFDPKFQEAARQHPNIKFYQMELNPETQPLLKFGPQCMPVVSVIKGNWARMLLGVGLEELEECIRKDLE